MRTRARTRTHKTTCRNLEPGTELCSKHSGARLRRTTYLVSEGLETEKARQFLESGMPTVESLMPQLAVPRVERLLGKGDDGDEENPF